MKSRTIQGLGAVSVRAYLDEIEVERPLRVSVPAFFVLKLWSTLANEVGLNLIQSKAALLSLQYWLDSDVLGFPLWDVRLNLDGSTSRACFL